MATKGKGKGSKPTAEELSQMKELFDLFDEDKSGNISRSELSNVMRGLGMNPTEAVIEKMMAEVDDDGNGEVSFKEFIEIMMKFKNEDSDEKDEQLEAAFKVIDKDNSGTIDAEELIAFLTTHGDKLTVKEAEDIIKEFDGNGDGVLDLKELKAFFSS